MVEPDTERVLAAVTVPLRIEAVTADISAIDLDDMVILTAADQITAVDRPDVKPNCTSEAGGVDHEDTPSRVGAG